MLAAAVFLASSLNPDDNRVHQREQPVHTVQDVDGVLAVVIAWNGVASDRETSVGHFAVLCDFTLQASGRHTHLVQFVIGHGGSRSPHYAF